MMDESSWRYKFHETALRWLAVKSYSRPKGRSTLAGPLFMQVQTTNRCNGKCVMCPYATTERTGPPATMDRGLYSKMPTLPATWFVGRRGSI